MYKRTKLWYKLIIYNLKKDKMSNIFNKISNDSNCLKKNPIINTVDFS